MSDSILFSVEDGIARLVLNRPDAGNAIDVALAQRLLELAITCEADPAIRCVTVTGTGKLFCAGGDIGVMGGAGERLPTVLTELIVPFHAAVARLAASPKPLVTLVNGPAAGAGMSLALLGDIVLSARSAHFTPAYSAIGLTADGGLSWLLPRLVGLRRAQEIILTNQRIKAEDAAAIGLVTRVVEDEAFHDEGAALAGRLAAGPVHALGAARALLATSCQTSFAAQLDAEQRSMAIAGADEAREGLAAMLAKRAPKFTKRMSHG